MAPGTRAALGGRLLIGLGVGVLGSILVSLTGVTGIILLIGLPIAVIAGSALGIILPARSLEAAGVLIGAGLVFTWAALRAASPCPGGEGACGDPNTTPLLVTGLAMAAVGIAVAVTAGRGRD